ncbi:beta-mannosidase [Flavobacterium akiainvivens]|uniref:Beta-mannosidase n=1 Tax=Flavobacterium akiainvivens TaxID=1202724 RepID=A0A0M8MHF9_9FLAO|nr:glycosyl hydrolase [Flavobacterium akiainvivens]KOS05857.1 beta-mannosidase [Flavobacterium akiainvivens]SFQ56719.1 mannan endo-1,4-beta-mannosidase [Flavobacterium akiainvivens]
MKKLYALLVFGFILASCGGDDNGFAGMTDDTPPFTEDVLTPANARSYMADPNATDETVALFYNLWKLQQTKYLVGQQDAFESFYGSGPESDMKSATGSDPGLLGSDFMFITDDQNTGEDWNWFHEQEIIITDDVKEAYGKGMVNMFTWHLREPYEGASFYTHDMTDFQKQNAFASILPGGENHEYYKAKLDKVADVLNNLKDNNNKLIPVIFRPFHEFDGSWFWWGAQWCTPAQFKQAWQFTVQYLRDTKNVHNVLYSYAPDNSYTTANQYLERYPGDGYIDVLGMDNYGDLAMGVDNGVAIANNKLVMLSNLAQEKVKVAALTETGWSVSPGVPVIPGWFGTDVYNVMTQNNVKLAFVMFWGNSQTFYFVPPAGQTNTQDFVDFANKPESVLQENMPDMYVMPAQ